ncbi:MAG: GNAT family N-acetyltransferase [Leptolyngbyaceae cyanobacterium SL_1_1]|nr:GNAT family N-acetyltransferase [Leptolyngbyaceae cyanobacterium RM1_1_2]NJO11799.1 GNAT family N-acetyltransferase [Leptolyngbyaceae cyanobacterium SL_1_1]
MGCTVINQLSKAQIQDLHQLYQTAWWARGRSLDDTRRLVQNTDEVFGLCADESARLIGFSRVLTDYLFRALILDVIVAPDYQGQGLGRILLDAMVNHPALAQVESFGLFCTAEMVPFYEKWGFTDKLTQKLMQRSHYERRQPQL